MFLTFFSPVRCLEDEKSLYCSRERSKMILWYIKIGLLMLFICVSLAAGGSTTSISLTSLRSRLKNTPVACILCDMDGTLLTDRHIVREDTSQLIDDVIKGGIEFFPATGRTRKSALTVTQRLLSRLQNAPKDQISGVFSQGLHVYGKGGHLIYEGFLEPSAIEVVAQFCGAQNVDVIAYAGDRILCTRRSAHTNKITDYCEPLPEEFPAGIQNLHRLQSVRVNKLIIMAEEHDIVRIRPLLTEHMSHLVTITKAQPGMLEILPRGASKGDGVRRLLEHLGLNPQHAVAIGDGENDLEMFQHVGVSVAMGNAKPIVREAATYVTATNNEGGVGAVLREVLLAQSHR